MTGVGKAPGVAAWTGVDSGTAVGVAGGAGGGVAVAVGCGVAVGSGTGVALGSARYHSAAFQRSGAQALGQKPPTSARAAGKARSQ